VDRPQLQLSKLEGRQQSDVREMDQSHPGELAQRGNVGGMQILVVDESVLNWECEVWIPRWFSCLSLTNIRDEDDEERGENADMPNSSALRGTTDELQHET